MITRYILALVLGFCVATGPVLAQVSQPESLTPPTAAQATGAKQKSPAAPKRGVMMDGEDEIVIIPGPKIGGSSKPVITPEILEALYGAVWQKVGKEYTDRQKLQDWGKWQHKFKGKLKTPEDLDAAIKEMVGSLEDRWTTYTSPADIADARQNFKDGKMPIGMLLRPHKDNKWHIDGMMYNSPAQKSTLREGDVITKINGKDITTMTAAEVSKELMGKEGEKVSVVAVYDNAEHTVELTFAKPGPNGVEIGMLPGNIAYARLPTFVKEEIVQQFIQNLGMLYLQAGGEVNGLIFDLRYNSGGLVTMALQVSGMFLEKGTIVRTTTREDRMVNNNEYVVEGIPPHLLANMPVPVAAFQLWMQTVPLVVLSNGSTASASEITIGALKDNNRAFIIGAKTFGKAVGYTNTPMPNGGVIQVTNLKYLTPNGTYIADTGIEPNKAVELTRGNAVNTEDDEQLLAGHAHLLEIVKKRAEQMADASAAATKPQAPAAAAEKPFVLHGLHVAGAVLGGLITLLLGAFAFSSLRGRIFKRRG
ncbi:MAG: PDZ domain-containing protein [Candidatus Obscuribacterales bacterium]|jgi:carboxyl-terminal processing protease|nr:PDZ domain-containing protein [Candidatus Obscuribacterales bacterium]MBX9940943.1 PDZ domain-containing protein [Candidatus Obscuribacterales bacterium]